MFEILMTLSLLALPLSQMLPAPGKQQKKGSASKCRPSSVYERFKLTDFSRF